MNTRFRKRPEKIATYRKKKETEGITNEPVTAETHEQLDYWLVPNIWKTQLKIWNQIQKLTLTQITIL